MLPEDEPELDELLSRPTAGAVRALATCPGDVVVLGAGGKMGPTLARMARRALDAAAAGARVIAVSRFSDPAVAPALHAAGVETVHCDLTDRAAVAALPDAPNVIFMAGQKFGTAAAPSHTWAMNALVPVVAAERYRGARLVAFSTGNVYPLTSVAQRGSRESDAPAPVGEYAMSCLARERLLEYVSLREGTRVAIVRLNYAVELRYGVLADLAVRVRDGVPVPLAMGAVNVIWQGDAAARALACLPLAATPPLVVNVTGPEVLSVRALATRLGERLGRTPVFEGTQAPDALLANTERARALFGAPETSLDWMLDAVAGWVARGGRLLGKPTHFERRDGRF